MNILFGNLCKQDNLRLSAVLISYVVSINSVTASQHISSN
jgi:hypothetical protein